jgi:hypothetical protein
MLPGSAPDDNVVAWHPDDEERWYLNRAPCTAAAAVATEALHREPEMQPPGGAHLDCFDEH